MIGPGVTLQKYFPEELLREVASCVQCCSGFGHLAGHTLSGVGGSRSFSGNPCTASLAGENHEVSPFDTTGDVRAARGGAARSQSEFMLACEEVGRCVSVASILRPPREIFGGAVSITLS